MITGIPADITIRPDGAPSKQNTIMIEADRGPRARQQGIPLKVFVVTMPKKGERVAFRSRNVGDALEGA